LVTVDDITRAITPIVEASPVRRVTLFGSYAKGTNIQGSDVDLLIDSAGQLRGIGFFALSAKIAQALPIASDIFEEREIKPNSDMRRVIANEGVVIYDR